MAKKTDAGDIVTTFPFSHEMSPIDDIFYGLQFDGINFWSLEKHPDDPGGKKLIRRWRIENKCLVLKDSWELVGQGNPVENMDGTAFCVEHYHHKLSGLVGPSVPGWTNKLRLNSPTACYFHPGDRLSPGFFMAILWPLPDCAKAVPAERRRLYRQP
jgi:hypothetical protein